MWGQYYWNHRPIGKPTKIGGVAKKQWKLDDEQTMEPDLLRSSLPPPIVKEVVRVDEEAMSA